MKKLLVILLVLGMAVPAMAADWNFYGSMRLDLVSYDRDKNFIGNKDHPAGDTVNSRDDIRIDLQGNSRIGAKVKASDTVSGRFEYGTAGGNANIRLLNGAWNFGSGTLIVGQDYTPTDQFYSSSWASTGIGGGELQAMGGFTYSSRVPQIKVKIGGFQGALVQNKSVGFNATTSGSAPPTQISTTIPKVELKYTYSADMFHIAPYLGWQSIEVETTGAGQTSKDIDSLFYGVGAQVKFGAAYVNLNVRMGENVGNFGLLTPMGRTADAGDDLTIAAVNAAGNVEDAEQMAYGIVIGFKASPTAKIEAGYGITEDELEVDGVKAETSVSRWYVNATITLDKGVYIVPEIGSIDYGDAEVTGVVPDVKLGDVMYYGAKIQINF